MEVNRFLISYREDNIVYQESYETSVFREYSRKLKEHGEICNRALHSDGLLKLISCEKQYQQYKKCYNEAECNLLKEIDIKQNILKDYDNLKNNNKSFDETKYKKHMLEYKHMNYIYNTFKIK